MPGVIAEAQAAAGGVTGGLATAQAIGEGRLCGRACASIAFIVASGSGFRDALSASGAVRDAKRVVAPLALVAPGLGLSPAGHHLVFEDLLDEAGEGWTERQPRDLSEASVEIHSGAISAAQGILASARH